MAKSLFNFYVDDMDKEQAISKLRELVPGANKGAMAAMLRIFIKVFNLNTDGIKLTNQDIAELIAAEYEFTTHCNKRSRL